MEIKLYNESSDRPHGSYTEVKAARVYPTGMLCFHDQKGKQLLTTLRFKIKEEVDEAIIINNGVGDNFCELASRVRADLESEPK